MKLITKEIRDSFYKYQDQSISKDPVVVCKFFNPTGAGTWYATEFNETTEVFFGYVSIFGDWNDEWGSFSLAELEAFRGRFGLGIERDIHFEPQRFSQINIGNSVKF